METNYYEIKMLRLKVLYLLAGWAVFIFAWICFSNIFHEFLFEDPVVRILLEQIHLREESFTISFIAMATLLLLYILIFSDWLGFDFLGTMGISNLFFIAEGIAMIVAGIISLWIMEMSGSDFSIPNDAFFVFIFSAMIIFPQNCLFILLFPILYWLWCDILKKREYCDYIPILSKIKRW